MTTQRTKLSLTVVCFLFGIATVMQLRTESILREPPGADSSTDLAAMAANLYDSNSALRSEVDTLQTAHLQNLSSRDAKSQTQLKAELQTLRAFNGADEATGPGVELTIDASLRPTDLLDLLNEVRNAGAEAIAIGSQRIVYNTPIGGVQGRLLVNNSEVQSPIVVDAIGDANVLDRALARKGGMVEYLQTAYPSATITLATSDTLVLPANTQPFSIKPGA